MRDHTPDVEFGYWSETLRRWHREGLSEWVADDYRVDHYFGFFGWARDLVGLRNLSCAIFAEPELVRDMFELRTRMILKAFEKPAKEVKLDYAHFWEDTRWNNSPPISPKHFEELMVPCYRRIAEFLRAHGVRIFIVDSDGNIDLLVPLRLEGGELILPVRSQKRDRTPVKLREKDGREVLSMGGIDKHALIESPKAISRELERVKPLVEEGG
jgi:uroporphyrinogen decarboxylase